MAIDNPNLVIAAEPIPLQADADGVVWVGRTRVTLDTVVAAFEQGAAAEEIVYQYPSLELADVYAVIAYYLQHRSQLRAYLHRWRQQADEAQQQSEARFNPRGIRERLLARSEGQGMASDAAAGG